MDFNSLVCLRQSVRRYTDQAVDDLLIKSCIETARMAPSANNSQPWHFIVVKDKLLVNEVARTATNQGLPINKFALQAPVIIAIVLKKPGVITRLAGALKHKSFEWTDLGIVADHFCLAAAEKGLGTCMIGWFNEKRVKKLLSVPRNLRVGLIITLGYAPEGYPFRKKIRKSFESILTFDSFKTR